MEIIEKSIEINAPASKVWEVLITPDLVREWISAFGEGTYAESDWNVGSEIAWKDNEGNIGAKGIITVMEPEKKLKADYYDEVNMSPPDPLGKYSEVYLLSGDNNVTTLSIKAGPLDEKYTRMCTPMWDGAVQNIKKVAEE